MGTSMLAMDVDMLRKNSSQVNSPKGISTKDLVEENNIASRNLDEPTSSISSSHSGESGADTQIQGVFGHAKGRHELTSPDPEYGSRSLVMLPIGDVSSGDSLVTFRENPYSGYMALNLRTGFVATESSDVVIKEEEFPEVKVDFQETFLGHTGPISRCRFSAAGTNIASASVDRTVRIWTYDSSTPTSRNATIYCGAEVMSLDWECKSDRLLLIGTAAGGIKAWNVDAKRVVCDLSTTAAYPSVLDLKCSPVDPIFVSAAASRG
ncbi:hypothetical protein ACLOJK_010079 [Asimina triloba]